MIIKRKKLVNIDGKSQKLNTCTRESKREGFTTPSTLTLVTKSFNYKLMSQKNEITNKKNAKHAYIEQ
jgi:hypothetical protein